MRINSIAELIAAPTASLYTVHNPGTCASMATPHKADVEHAFRHGDGHVYAVAYREIDPHAVTLSAKVFAMCNNAAAILQNELGYVWDTDRDLWVAPRKPEQVPVNFELHRHKHEADPKTPSTWPKREHGPQWEHADRRDCAICFAERVPVLPDPDGLPRCKDCWEDLQPCVNCGNVSTRPHGEHFCRPTKKDAK